LGSGKHEAFVSPTPINYQDSDGTWKPIDPRFDVAPGGFISRRNSLVIGAAQQQAVLRLANGSNTIGWVPQALLAAMTGGEETTLASPLRAEQSTLGALTPNGRTIRYSHSWSLSDLSEEVTAGAGRVEQSLIIAQRPALTATPLAKGVNKSEGVLSLRSTLYLMPGAQVYANGAVQKASFATDGALEIRDAKGQMGFMLPPARAFEQSNPHNGVAARYHLKPKADGQWQVDVDTPWSWWADTARTYPVVLDPAVQVLQPTADATIAIHETSAGSGVTAPNADVYQFTVVGTFVGAGVRGRQQGYVKFPLPSLPPGAQAIDAKLVAVPDNTNGSDPTYSDYSDQTTLQKTYVWAAPSDWSALLSITSTASSNYLAPISPILATIKKPSPTLGITDTFPATFWEVTSIVQGWYNNPTTNNGFVLGLFFDSYHHFEDTLPDGSHPTFAAFPTTSGWSNLDDAITAGTEDGAGLGLLIIYSAPQLPANQLQTVRVPSATPQGFYRDQYHEYLWPTPIPRWSLVAAVSAIDKTPLDLLASGVITISSDPLPASPVFGANAQWQPAYVAVNGNHTLPADLRLRVQPNDPPAVNNDAFTYQLQTADAVASPPMPSPTGAISVPINVAGVPVRGQELNLAQDTTVEIKVPYASAGLTPSTAQFFELQLFAPELLFGSRTDKGMEVTRGPDAFDIEFSVHAGQTGAWLLAASHTVVNANLIAQVTICQSTDQVVRYPLNGHCVELRRPPSTLTVGSTYQELGNLRLFSPAGFIGSCATVCATNQTASGVPVMPLIGFKGDNVHWVALKSGVVTLNRTGNAMTTSPDARLVMADFSSATQIVSLPVLRGAFQADPTTGVISVSAPPVYLLVGDPLPPNESSGFAFTIDQASARLRASGVLTRAIQPTPGDPTSTFVFNAAWSVTAAGGVSLAALDMSGRDPSSIPVTFTVGTLVVAPPAGGYRLEYASNDADPLSPAALPAFRQIRMTNAALAQPANLGGARVPVQALFFPPAVEVKDETGQTVALACGSSCFDLRGPDDDMTAGGPFIDRHYRMPDLIIQDSANTVMFNTGSGVDIYSSDHPLAPKDANGVSFSYQAFGANVRTFQGQCPIGTAGPQTTVIVGDANMALPNAGSDSATTGGPLISAGFTLCEDSLREVRLSFSTGKDTAIPVGSTGLFLNYLGGTIDLVPKAPGSPGFTTIKLDLGFRAFDPTVDASTVFAAGQVTIDTRGLFDVQAHAGVQVFAGIGAAGDGHFWVAWSPLDLGFQTQECAPSNFSPADFPVKYLSTNLCQGNELFYGMFRAHMWQGQGWQHKYNWLPDDSATHMAARFTASVTIKAGLILDWTFVKIPPDDITLFSITLAFGQFCSNDPCTTYEWGVMGSFSILGYDVGVYYGFDSGLSFILGSDNHVLIDEAGGAQVRAPAGVGSVQSNTIYTVTVNPGVPSVMFGLAYTSTVPAFVLKEPGLFGRVISYTTHYADVVASRTSTGKAFQITLAVKNPRAGVWQACVCNVPTFPTIRYQFFSFSNRPVPSLNLSTLPGTVFNPATIPITWTSNVQPGAGARLSLYYELFESAAPLFIPGSGGPIVEHLPLTTSGSFNWNPAGLGPGYFKVFARIENGAAAAVASCGNQPYVPTVTIASCSTMFNPALSLASGEVDMPGILHVVDTIAPAPPKGVAARAEDISSVVVRWNPNSETDLAGYIVTCQQGPVVKRLVRVPPSLEATSSLSETARVVGLDPAPATCFVQAYDTSYNLSSPSAAVVARPSLIVPLPPVATTFFSITQRSAVGVRMSWAACISATGYLLFYEPVVFSSALQASAPDVPAGSNGNLTGNYQANQGPSPINVGNVLSATLTGLHPGTVYKVWIKPYDADGRVGAAGPKLSVTAPFGLYLPAVRH
jgi:hypothetical protein